MSFLVCLSLLPVLHLARESEGHKKDAKEADEEEEEALLSPGGGGRGGKEKGSGRERRIGRANRTTNGREEGKSQGKQLRKRHRRATTGDSWRKDE